METAELTEYTDKLRKCFWDDYVRDKKGRSVPAFHEGLLKMKDEVEKMIDSDNSVFSAMSGGRLSGKSSILQYIILMKALKKAGYYCYLAMSKRSSVIELKHIFGWLQTIGMEDQILIHNKEEIRINNGSTIVASSMDNSVPQKHPFDTVVFDDVLHAASFNNISKSLIPLLLEYSNTSRSYFFTYGRDITDYTIHPTVGGQLQTEYCNEKDMIMKIIYSREKFIKSQLDYYEGMI